MLAAPVNTASSSRTALRQLSASPARWVTGSRRRLSLPTLAAASAHSPSQTAAQHGRTIATLRAQPHSRYPLPPLPHTARRLLSSSSPIGSAAAPLQVPSDDPTTRYQALVEKGVLRDDSHQRSIVKVLQRLHDELKTYKQSSVPDPDEAVQSRSCGLLSWLPFGRRGGGEADAVVVPKGILKGIPKGLYLYGNVGTGKSMLMDLFYDTLPDNIRGKRRIHFHQFMMEAHKRAHYYKSKTHRPSGIVMMMSNPTSQSSSSSSSSAAHVGEESDVNEAIAREMSRSYSVLCFDEFQVTDIADAMILRGLLERITAYGTVCVMTSNRHPDELYKNGIQRSSFLPTIDLLKKHYRVTDLNSGTDYRKQPRALSTVYFSPLDVPHNREFDKMFEALTSSDASDPVQQDRPLTIWGRTLKVPLSTTNVARFTFDELCGTPKSAADYIEICNNFGAIFVEAVPRMGLHQRDLARRFITFIDAAYESKTKLFASSQVPILQIFSGDANKDSKPTADQMRALMDDLGLTMDDLGGSPIFTGDEELFAFARVISRLTEMGTKQYAESTRPAFEWTLEPPHCA